MALSPVSKDTTQEKKRVEKARERRLGTQRRQIERRRLRRDKRYGKTSRGKALQILINWDFSKFQAAVKKMADHLADLGRAVEPPKNRRGMRPTFTMVDEWTGPAVTGPREDQYDSMVESIARYAQRKRESSELESTTRLAEKAALTVQKPQPGLKFTAE